MYEGQLLKKNGKFYFLVFFSSLLFIQCRKAEFTPVDVIPNDSLRVYLTFDDGPDTIHTPLILDILKEKHVKATFFLHWQAN